VTDHLRSTTLTVDQAGVVRNRYLYAPFGDAAKAEGPSARYRFTGEVVVAGSGSYLLGARVFDPETGRFLQPDPLVSQAYDPQAFNRYGYALNSPMNWIDPSGLAPVSAFGEGGGAGSEEGGDSFDGWGFDFTFWWGSQNTPIAGAPPAPSEATDVPMTGEEVPSQSGQPVGVQVAGGNELTDAEALARARRMVTLSYPGHPGATPGFDDPYPAGAEAMRQVAEETLVTGATVAGAVLAPQAEAAAAGALARGVLGARLLQVGQGFQETFDPSGVPSAPVPLPRAGSRYQQLGRGLGYVANYGPAVWGFIRGALE